MIPKGTSVTLVEPQYPVNVGHVARLLKNFGIPRLNLVKPNFDMSVAAVYASHATDVLDEARIVTFDQVRRDNELLVATTAVKARKKSNVIRRTVSPERLRGLLAASSSSSLVFGRDTTGLTNDEIRRCDVTMSIDVGTSHRALNLGHAVAIVLYSASRGTAVKGSVQSRDARELFAKSFYELAVASRLQQYKLKSLLEAGLRIATVSKLTDRQLNLMTGTFKRARARIEASQDGDSKT